MNTQSEEQRMGFAFDFGFSSVLLGTALAVVAAWPRARTTAAPAPFSIPYWPVQVFGTVPPVLGLGVCLLVAALWHHDDACRTHCGVYNFWPSLSAAIGNNAPETYIWRVAVALHNTVTLGDSLVLYHNLVRHVPPTRLAVVAVRVCTLTKMASCMSLFLLTYVSSTENFSLHETGFVMWLITGSTSIALFLCLWLYGRRYARDLTGCPPDDVFAWWWLVGSSMLYFACLPLAAFLYWLHNAYCQPYVYSFFGITEWLIVMAYIAACGWGHHVAFRTYRLRLSLVASDKDD